MKRYCVHIYTRPYEVEDIEAENPQEAEEIAMHRYNHGDYSDVHNVEVMRQCECGLDNDTDNGKCDECGETL